MNKKKQLLYFSNLIIAFVVLFVLITLITGCSTPKATIAEPETPPEVPIDDSDLPPEIPSADIDTPPAIPDSP